MKSYLRFGLLASLWLAVLAGGPAQAQPPTPIPLVSPANDAKDTGLQPVLTWTGNAAEEYYVRVFLRPDPADPTKDITLGDASARVKGTSHEIGAKALAVGKKYHWQVIGLSRPGVSEVRSFTTSATAKVPGAKDQATRGLFVRRAFAGELKEKAALFSYSKENGDDSKYSLEFAAGYQGDLSPESTLIASLEGKLGTESTDADALRFRFGPEFYPILFGKDVVTSVVFKYEGNQSLTTEKALGEIRFTPVDPKSGIQQFKGDPAGTQFRLTPTFGIDLGRTIDSGASLEDEDTVFRILARPGGSIRFNQLKGGPLQFVDLYADYKFHYLPTVDGKDTFGLFTTGITFGFSETFSLEFSYSVGRDAPSFLRQEKLEGAIGVKFN